MKLFLTLLFVVIATAQYNSQDLNEFSADVDIYDIGRMGRGKNAGSWHRSPTDKQEIFYYLAMQPWRHLVWTAYEDKMWVKYYINEDASAAPSKRPSSKLSYESTTQDYCRKEYTTPMDTYDIDWTRIDPQSRLESVDINGLTCYRYPAKIPLENIYLLQHYTRKESVTAMTPCRYDFIGGKSITFRSFNSFSKVFIGSTQPNGYQENKTKCYIDPTPNNVETDLAIVLGISDSSVVQKINGALTALKDLKTVKQTKVYYSTGESVRIEEITNWDTLKMKSVTSGSVDAIVSMAKDNLIKRIKSGDIQRGTMVVLMDTSLSTTFDAQTAFDRNGITVHTILYNPKEDNQMTNKARTLLSVGAQHHEFTSSDDASVSAVVNELFVGIRANLTERCDRTKCDGFCDGRDRCTCPMCCENNCFFSYCDTTTATCKPWPPGKPKEKITCPAPDCIGKQECIDLVGCTYTHYNDGCKPTAKCMKPVCVYNATVKKEVCVQTNACEEDKKPTYQNRCWNYTCNTQSGNCERDQSGDECGRLPSLCHEYYCEPTTLKCKTKERTCVKTSPYIEMPCYEGRCNRKTGRCENALTCDKYTGCGVTADKSRCGCDPSGGKFTCSCKTDTTGYCSEKEVCDSTVEGKDPHCVKSPCGEDLYIEGCRIKKCDTKTNQTYWDDMNCDDKVEFKFVSGVETVTNEQAKDYCKDKYGNYCYEGECFGELKAGEEEKAACGKCVLNDGFTTSGKKKIYTVTYTENCKAYYPRCADGSKPDDYSMFGKKGEEVTAECKAVGVGSDGKTEYQCVYPTLDADKGYDFCKQCYSSLECYGAKEFKNYIYNNEKGTCSQQTLKIKDQCTVCNSDDTAYISTCPDGSKVNREYTYTHGGLNKKFEYHIPKQCSNEQCIPEPGFNCMTRVGKTGVEKIVEQLLACSPQGAVTGVYHYSALFDSEKFFNGEQQSAEFMLEADKEAYCEWTVIEKDCNYCGVVGEDLVKIDRCEKEKADLGLGDAITLSCVTETNTCKIDDFACDPSECYYFVPDTTTGECVNSTKSTCEATVKKIGEVKNSYVKKSELEPEIVCNVKEQCNKFDNTCPVVFDSVNCENAFKEYMKEKDPTDFGCRIPNKVCDETTYHCTFTPMTHPENDTAFFTNRDEVKFGHKCYNYSCVESIVDGKLEHHWVLSEASRIETSIQPDHLCETVYCDAELGYTIHKPKVCTPIEAFKMTEEQAQCFSCKCSYVDGEPQIVMLSSTNEETYELDACGNCIVRDRLTGEQKNKHVECILSATVNLTGAIAGATVAASVVFGLIGAMVVVSIGAFQTYQLVSSAMKNVISTTLENPEFVAADNEATNTLANGD